jgi:hypothetical protein
MLGPMVVKHEHVVLSNTTPVQIPFDDGDEVVYNVSFRAQNIDESAVVYIGGAGVTSTSYGIKLEPNDVISFDEMPRYPGLYAISSIDDSVLATLRMSR